MTRAGRTVADAPRASEPAPPPALGWPVRLGLLLTLVALLAHARVYDFLTDDAFISFRYAHNFAHGHGLVFNPGFERVEGYSNFLWVLVLAAFDAVGIAPERAANPLSLLATAGLWWVVVRFTLRHRPSAGAEWTVLVPPAFLAASRSVAVWSTGGLETRVFELLATAGLMRAAEEVDALRAGRTSGRPWGAILLGLAALTRPDGALVAVCALGAALGLLWRAPRERAQFAAGGAVREWLRLAWPAVALIGAQYALRLAYYGALEPNTYYAKVGGRLRPDSGLEYVWAFALEYAAWLWLPGLIAAVLAWRKSSAATWMVLAAAALLPHVAYVIAIGGDHFEYRPLDVLFPFIGLLLYEGARAFSGGAPRRVTTAALAVLVLAGELFLPWRSHADFPRTYMPGFPGLQVSRGPVPDAESAPADHFLDPDRSPVTRLGLLRAWAEAHRHALLRLTSIYSGIRQEEHRHFFALIHGQAAQIREVMQRGLLPPDTYMAMDCVGAIPYVTGVRTLDRLGLTDAHVARQPFMGDLVAHGKEASLDYARARGVDLWFFHPAQLILPAASSSAMRAFTPAPDGEPAVMAAELDGHRWLIGRFPRGDAAGLARFPRLHFWNMRDSLDVRAARSSAIAAWEAKLDSLPHDGESHDALAFLLAEGGRWAEAATHYRELARITPADPEPLVNLASCLDEIGRPDLAVDALREAHARAAAEGDLQRAHQIETEIARLGSRAP